jgi:hypothetical protein
MRGTEFVDENSLDSLHEVDLEVWTCWTEPERHLLLASDSLVSSAVLASRNVGADDGGG